MLPACVAHVEHPYHPINYHLMRWDQVDLNLSILNFLVQLHTQLSRQDSVRLSSLPRDASLDKRFRVDLLFILYNLYCIYVINQKQKECAITSEGNQIFTT